MQKRLKKAIFTGSPAPSESSPAQKLQQLRQDMPHAGYIRQAGLLAMLPISSATLWRWVSKGDFPQPVKLSARITAWPVEAVQSWLAESGDEPSPKRVMRNSAASLKT